MEPLREILGRPDTSRPLLALLNLLNARLSNLRLPPLRRLLHLYLEEFCGCAGPPLRTRRSSPACTMSPSTRTLWPSKHLFYQHDPPPPTIDIWTRTLMRKQKGIGGSTPRLFSSMTRGSLRNHNHMNDDGDVENGGQPRRGHHGRRLDQC